MKVQTVKYKYAPEDYQILLTCKYFTCMMDGVSRAG